MNKSSIFIFIHGGNWIFQLLSLVAIIVYTKWFVDIDKNAVFSWFMILVFGCQVISLFIEFNSLIKVESKKAWVITGFLWRLIHVCFVIFYLYDFLFNDKITSMFKYIDFDGSSVYLKVVFYYFWFLFFQNWFYFFDFYYVWRHRLHKRYNNDVPLDAFLNNDY